MKKILFILFIMVSAFAFSEELKGVYGLTFGSSQDEVKTALQAKHISIVGDRTESIAFTGTFNDDKFSVGEAVFKNGKLAIVVFMFSGLDPVHYRDKFEYLVKEVDSKYPKVQSGDCSKFVEPFSDGDGYEVTALKSGHGVLKHAWFFASGRQVVVEVNHELNVFLAFEAYDLMTADEKGEKKLSDF